MADSFELPRCLFVGHVPGGSDPSDMVLYKFLCGLSPASHQPRVHAIGSSFFSDFIEHTPPRQQLEALRPSWWSRKWDNRFDTDGTEAAEGDAKRVAAVCAAVHGVYDVIVLSGSSDVGVGALGSEMEFLRTCSLPVYGVCFGLQLLANAFARYPPRHGARVAAHRRFERPFHPEAHTEKDRLTRRRFVASRMTPRRHPCEAAEEPLADEPLAFAHCHRFYIDPHQLDLVDGLAVTETARDDPDACDYVLVLEGETPRPRRRVFAVQGHPEFRSILIRGQWKRGAASAPTREAAICVTLAWLTDQQ